MTVRKYIERKNEIIERFTGVTLVPKDQIIDGLVPKELDISCAVTSCPYCIEFQDDDITRCRNCPMNKADNNCAPGGFYSSPVSSTWKQYIEEKHKLDLEEETQLEQELASLVEEFNVSNGFKEKECEPEKVVIDTDKLFKYPLRVKQLSSTNFRFDYKDVEGVLTLKDPALPQSAIFHPQEGQAYITSIVKSVVCADNIITVNTRNSVYKYELLEYLGFSDD